jgi:hypothetical protein
MFRRSVSVLVAFFLLGFPLPLVHANQPVGVALGVVTQASNAHFNSAKLSEGATVFDGDQLSTAAEGALQFRGSSARLFLAAQTGVTLHALPKGTQTELRLGTLVFSTSNSNAMEIVANRAAIRSATDRPTVAQVSIVSAKEIRVTPRQGSVEVTFNGETEKLSEGGTYRVMLEPPPASPGSDRTRSPGRVPKGFFVVLIGAASVITFLAVQEALESPDRP